VHSAHKGDAAFEDQRLGDDILALIRGGKLRPGDRLPCDRRMRKQGGAGCRARAPAVGLLRFAAFISAYLGGRHARGYVDAFSTGDFDAARAMLADDVRVIAIHGFLFARYAMDGIDMRRLPR